MTTRIGSNISSILVQRRLSESTSILSKSYERLSSGQRINRASDDAAGLAIASVLKASIRVTNQAVRNVNDAISMANIAESALGELKNITNRQRELATQAANGSYTLAQRRAMNEEANQLVEEFNRIVGSTEFNDSKLFDGRQSAVRIQAGTGTEGGLSFETSDSLSRLTGNGTFFGQTTYTSGTNPNAIGLGDLNGDGKLDMVTTDYGANTISVMIGGGDGSFSARTAYTTNGNPYSVALGDLNGDAKTDIVTADRGSSKVSVFLGNGNGTFSARLSYTTANSPYMVAVGDLNGDGILDLATADSGSNAASVLIGNGDGSFQAKISYTTNANPQAIALGDINGDGYMDMVTGDRTANKASVFLGRGDGTFSSRTSYTTGVDPRSIALGDLNSDGTMDMVTMDYSSNAVSVLLGAGDGTFSARTSYSTNSMPYSMALGDINNDGALDIVTGDWNSTASILIGDGDGTFASKTTYSTGTSLTSVALGDINGDSVPDMAVAEYSSNKAAVILAKTSKVSTVAKFNICTRQGALDAMALIDGTLQRIQNELGSIGASTSRFGAALSTLQAKTDNEASASSRITDADIAEESASFIKNRILQQAASSVLAQANQEPALALQLLKNV